MTVLTHALIQRGLTSVEAATGTTNDALSLSTLDLRIGVVPISMVCDHAPTVAVLKSFYSDCVCDGGREDAIRVEVLRKRRRFGRCGVEIRVDGELRYFVSNPANALPFIEWAINWQMIRCLPRYFQVHAGVLEIEGEGVVFPATTGSGKSTLTVALMRRGWRYLSDEFALIDPDTMELHPYPKAVCIKEGSFPVLRSLGVCCDHWPVFVTKRKGRLRFLMPSQLGGVQIAPCPIRHIFFCHYAKNQLPWVREMSGAEAVLRLNEQSFNFNKFHARGVRLMSDVVRRARCYELNAGEITATCNLVHSTVRGRPTLQG